MRQRRGLLAQRVIDGIEGLPVCDEHVVQGFFKILQQEKPGESA
jgi:hypothetical protein